MNEESKLVWTADFYKPKLEKYAGNVMVFSGGGLYYTTNVQEVISIYRHDLTSGENKLIYTAEGASVLYFNTAPDGTLYAQVLLYHRETDTITNTVLKISEVSDEALASGASAVEKLLSLEGPKRQNSGMQPFAVDAEGNFYFGYSDAIAVHDKSGKLLFELPSEGAMLMNLIILHDGHIAVEMMRVRPPVTPPGLYQMRPIKVQARTWDEPIGMSMHKGKMSAGFGHYLFFIIDREDNLCGYNTETNTPETLFNCRDLNINIHQVEAVQVAEDGTVHIVNISGGADGIVYEVATAVKKPAAEDKRVTLEYAAYSLNQWAREKIAEFNRTDPAYQIHVTEYVSSALGSANEIAAATQRLLEVMCSDTPPDIIDLMLLPKEYLAYKGLLADLYPMIAADDTLSRESFLPAPLKALETDGKLCYIMPHFTLNVFVGRRSVVGDKSMLTLEALEALMDAHPGVSIAHDWSNTGALGILANQCLNDYVNWKTRQCRFNDGAFEKLLELAARHPAPSEDNPLGGLYPLGTEGGKNLYNAALDGDILMENIMVHSFWQQQYYMDFFGGEPAYKSYPTRQGSGIMLSDTSMYAISSKSAHKNAAWQLIRELLVSNTFPLGFPMLKADLDKKAKDEMQENYVDKVENVPWEVTPDLEGRKGFKLDKAGRLIRYKQGQGRQNVKHPATQEEIVGDMVWIYAASQDEYDKTLDLINNISGVVSPSRVIFDIITEAAKPYFSGAQTAASAASAIQSQVSAYLSNL
jgi:hypothetical protein